MVHNMIDIENCRDIDYILTILKRMNTQQLQKMRELADNLEEKL